MIEAIEVEGVRCFSVRQKVPLRPLTVLVGENSSGKSTFLALTRIAWDIAKGKADIDFNEEPFQLGSFDQIASSRGSRRISAKEFHIGIELQVGALRRAGRELPRTTNVIGSFRRGIAPRLSEWSLTSGSTSCVVSFGASSDALPELTLTGAGGESRAFNPGSSVRYRKDPSEASVLPFLFSRLFAWAHLRDDKTANANWPDHHSIEQLEYEIARLVQTTAPRPLAFAPIRSQPQRTYDPLLESPRPEGSHVPVTLARLSSEDVSAWRDLLKPLERFGKASGLFSGIEVRRVGRKESDPFQIQVNVAGQPFNLMDVGYGVSQILPIIVDLVRAPAGQTFLLQQPEVHLHPRAQAELGTFLASLVSAQKKRFLVETHSDHLVDRIRMDVRDKRGLKADQVLILYFERKAGQVEIHPIELDEHGNLRNVPDGYRSFFLEEDRRLLGIA